MFPVFHRIASVFAHSRKGICRSRKMILVAVPGRHNDKFRIVGGSAVIRRGGNRKRKPIAHSRKAVLRFTHIHKPRFQNDNRFRNTAILLYEQHILRAGHDYRVRCEQRPIISQGIRNGVINHFRGFHPGAELAFLRFALGRILVAVQKNILGIVRISVGKSNILRAEYIAKRRLVRKILLVVPADSVLHIAADAVGFGGRIVRRRFAVIFLLIMPEDKAHHNQKGGNHPGKNHPDSPMQPERPVFRHHAVAFNLQSAARELTRRRCRRRRSLLVQIVSALVRLLLSLFAVQHETFPPLNAFRDTNQYTNFRGERQQPQTKDFRLVPSTRLIFRGLSTKNTPLTNAEGTFIMSPRQMQ